MKPTGIISSFLFLLFALSGSAQVTQRNILATTYSPEKVAASIIPKDKWKPYPLTPKQWKDAVPDSMLKGIVDGASSVMSYKFEPISGSVSMDFKRTGDRLRKKVFGVFPRISAEPDCLMWSVLQWTFLRRRLQL
ncbi:MAG: hypothetical protein LW815_10325 [Chitinophagaceae bacterium]|nr:hypothetical protein [Chitinophagaceae bacterium]